ncbi:hypothetical protein D3C86_2154680 [compost metagenome]
MPGSLAQGMSQTPKFLKSILIFVIFLMICSLVSASGIDLKKSALRSRFVFAGCAAFTAVVGKL